VTPFALERRAWRSALIEAANPGAVVVVSDVAACYPSIGELALRAASRAAGGDPAPLIEELRRVWANGSRGLPIGPAASSYLADAVLAIADAAADGAGVVPVRWVDDVAFVGDHRSVGRSARAWAATLRELGLREHDGKHRSVEIERLLYAQHRTSIARGRLMPSSAREDAVSRAGHPHARPPGGWRLAADRRPARAADRHG